MHGNAEVVAPQHFQRSDIMRQGFLRGNHCHNRVMGTTWSDVRRVVRHGVDTVQAAGGPRHPCLAVHLPSAAGLLAMQTAYLRGTFAIEVSQQLVTFNLMRAWFDLTRRVCDAYTMAYERKVAGFVDQLVMLYEIVTNLEQHELHQEIAEWREITAAVLAMDEDRLASEGRFSVASLQLVLPSFVLAFGSMSSVDLTGTWAAGD
ncbi:hypothetical protein VTK56DRAFT_504 [Thermocarpiscus australiensis]